ncbi:acetylcholine-gated cation-selective channel [Branchiostoma belcheri]|nr:acetylcholine-gated cation-selective channel [Branchiostoma belcheri]
MAQHTRPVCEKRLQLLYPPPHERLQWTHHHVTLDLALANIINLDEKNQVLTAEVWLRLKWTDEFLTWNVSDVNHEFGGWLEAVVMISSDGLVDWKAPAVTMSACLVDVSDFPFDKQKCYLQFGSWNPRRSPC